MALKRYFLLSSLLLILLSSCKSPKRMQYETLIDIPLGMKFDEIGSNFPILESYPNRQGLPNEFLLDIPELIVCDNTLYISDSYNRRISVFPLKQKKPITPSLIIPNKGDNYFFERPYKIFVDYQKNIYVLVSIQDIETYEVQSYENQNASLKEYSQVQKNIFGIPNKNFYVYKFSANGTFLYKIGFDGLDKDPMSFPKKISGDQFGNLYINFVKEKSDRSFYQVVRKYTNTGTLNFEFNTQYMTMDTKVNGIKYNGSILSIDNYIHNEQLLVLTEYQPTKNEQNKIVPPIIDNIWSSLNVYSLLLNDFLGEIFKTISITESVLGVDQTGRIFLQSYDEKVDTIKIHILNPKTKKESIHYAPIHSSYYILSDYFIDEKGNIYNYIVDRQRKFILLRWNTGLDNEGQTS